MLKFSVGLSKEKTLLKHMDRLGIREADIVEKFIKSSGAGGQNVNKVSTAVYVKHTPTGIEVKCQQDRSQGLNRYNARKILLKKVETLMLGSLSKEKQRIEKIRRQKRRRSRRAQLKLLEDKHKHSAKKRLRQVIREIE